MRVHKEVVFGEEEAPSYSAPCASNFLAARARISNNSEPDLSRGHHNITRTCSRILAVRQGTFAPLGRNDTRMASASTRGLRSRLSRYSSPALVVEKEPEGPTAEALSAKSLQKTFLDKWVEPPLRPPAPSFEDTKGLERVGVLEHMAPLGQPPSQKMLQKLKLGHHRSLLRPIPGQPEEVLTPTTEVGPLDFPPSPPDVQMRSGSAQPQEATPMSSPDRRSMSEQVNDGVSLQVDVTPPPRKSSFASSISTSTNNGASPRKWAADRMSAHVEAAIKKAEEIGSPNIIPGLRNLHRDALTDTKLWTVLEAFLNSSPSPEQAKIFKRYVKNGIKNYKSRLSTESFHSFQGPPPLGTAQIKGHNTSAILQNTMNTPGPPQITSTIASPFRLKPSPAIISNRPSPAKSSHSPSDVPAASPVRLANGMAEEVGDTALSSPRRRRSRSASSSSSLSSAKSIPETFAPVIEADSETQSNGARPVRSGGQRQAQNRLSAGNRSRSSATLPTSSKPPYSEFIPTSKFGTKRLKRTREELEIDAIEVEKRRRELEQQTFQGYNEIPRPEINERTILEQYHYPPLSLTVQVPPPVVHAHPLNPASATLSSPISVQAPPDHHIPNGTSRKRAYNEIDQDDNDIPTPLSSSPAPLPIPPPPGVAGSTRAATPRAAKGQLPGKARKSARVMVSPNKPKNGGITAGISRAGPGRDSVIGNGADSSAEDNDEYCASCSGEGTLLCCDGCTNSFHHTCLEPPLDPDAEVDGEWFCPQCISRRNKGPIETSGLFGRIIGRVDDVIPKAFSLPYDIREYFEGVKTGDEGEYEDFGLPRTQNNAVKMNRAGFFEEPNYKELRDSKGNFITCYRCGLTSGGRDIIPCDYCPARWHLDCLSPPLAVPPRRRIGDKPNASWRCPLHIEYDLIAIGRADAAAPGDLGRLPRLRRPKNAIPIDIVPCRDGIVFKNNGIIDVDLEKDQVPDFREIDTQGHVYRLPEKGIRLDFIDRIKRSWYEDRIFPDRIGRRRNIREELYRPSFPGNSKPKIDKISPTAWGSAPTQDISMADVLAIQATAAANATLRNKSLREQQAVLTLAGMTNGDESAAGAWKDRITTLTNQLVADAPDEVVELVEDDEVQTLQRLVQLAQARLAVLGAPAPTPALGIGINGTETSAKVEDADGEDSGSEMEMEMDITD